MISIASVLLMSSLVAGTPWRFEDYSETTTSTSGPYIEVQTGPRKKYLPLQEMGVEVAKSHSLVFQVRAKRDVHILLQESAGDTRRRVYEITIGGWANTLSVIRKAVTDGRIMVNYRHRLLSATEFRYFWIHWAEGRVTVGLGKRLGDKVFMSYRDPVPHTVNYVSISTGWGSPGTWRFDTPSPIIGVWTTDDANLMFSSLNYRGYNVKERTNIVFFLKASNDANVLLTGNKLPYSNMYWICLGSLRNTMSFIRKGRIGPNLAHALHSPLYDEHYLPFWISWELGEITVGEGTEVGRRQFMSWTDPNPFVVVDLYVSTGGGSSGHWLTYLDVKEKEDKIKPLPASDSNLSLNL